MITSGRRLTRAQLDAWATFGREWGPFKKAWIGRGFLLPPTGSAHDDDGNPSQRSMLWRIADAYPAELGHWVAEAPGRTTREVIAHVLRRWVDRRGETALEDDLDEQKRLARLEDAPRARARMTSLRQILRGEP